ncbi:phage baseplate assembly protein V [Pseudoalteromonas ruthenica]|uniref:phage baseplate assembly protein V n=1 Tax=Pseudoalteromonas ruthenica TaxID=151081 RepID=UPI00110A2F59|nr:phage baseplate assembly protein V [Pseudoalteromonas ruthenica]
MTKHLLLGKHRAEVVSVDHPKSLQMCQVRLLGLWDEVPDKDLPWAEYHLPFGARANEGDFKPCQPGDTVWVEFVAGDSRFPLITGSAYYAPNKVPNLPHEIFNGELAQTHARTESQPKPSEPSPKDRISTQHGITTEVTHEGAHRTTHRETGTSIELTKDGEVVIYAANDAYRSAQGDYKGEIIGMFEENVEGNYVLNANANVTENVGSELVVNVKGNAKFNVDGNFDVAKASLVKLLQGAGVVTGECVCHYTGSPHGDVSSKVFASK